MPRTRPSSSSEIMADGAGPGPGAPGEIPLPAPAWLWLDPSKAAAAALDTSDLSLASVCRLGTTSKGCRLGQAQGPATAAAPPALARRGPLRPGPGRPLDAEGHGFLVQVGALDAEQAGGGGEVPAGAPQHGLEVLPLAGGLELPQRQHRQGLDQAHHAGLGAARRLQE